MRDDPRMERHVVLVLIGEMRNWIKTVVHDSVVNGDSSRIGFHRDRVSLLGCSRLVTFPFSVRYLAVAHFLRDVARYGRVLNRRRAVFLLGGVSVIVEVREKEVEEHRVR